MIQHKTIIKAVFCGIIILLSSIGLTEILEKNSEDENKETESNPDAGEQEEILSEN